MERRRFLQALASLTALAAIDPVEATAHLLSPKRTYFDLGTASSHGVLAYQFQLPSDWIAKETARLLRAQLHMAENIHRSYDAQFRLVGGGIGTTINVKLPTRYARAGA